MMTSIKLLPLFRIILIIIMSASVLLFSTEESHGCTCWAAAGDKVAGGGTIIAKNTDQLPQKNELRLVIPETGFTYLGLLPIRDSKEHNVVAGINEKGLCVVTMVASSIPRQKRHTDKNIIVQILSSYESINDVLNNQEMFSKTNPSFYMMADKTKIALIEVAPDGNFSIRQIDSGILFHTNHYIDEKFHRFNEKIGKSSQLRLNRIGQLLMSHPSPLKIEDFINFSEDRTEGPNHSIWRTGDAHDKERTLASWIVAIPKEGSPELYLKIANPGENEKIYNMKLDKPFWTNGLEE